MKMELMSWIQKNYHLLPRTCYYRRRWNETVSTVAYFIGYLRVFSAFAVFSCSCLFFFFFLHFITHHIPRYLHSAVSIFPHRFPLSLRISNELFVSSSLKKLLTGMHYACVLLNVHNSSIYQTERIISYPQYPVAVVRTRYNDSFVLTFSRV